MAASAQYVATPSDEESHGAPPCGTAVPRQVRLARRSAAAALVVSAVTFAAVATMAARDFLQARNPTAAVGGSHGAAAVVGLAAAPSAAAPHGMVTKGLTKAAGGVYLEQSMGGEKVRDLPAGSLVLPMRSGAGGWVQAVVPAQRGESATMGWLHAPTGFDAAPEASQSARPVAAMSRAEYSQKWAELRAKNAQNKEHLAELQASMKEHSIKVAERSTESMVKQGAAQLHVSNLRQGMEKLGQEVQKELPPGFAREVAAAFK